MAEFSGDFNKMQEEALSRLREMQKRSRTAINRPNPPQNPAPPPRPNPQPHSQPNNQPNNQHNYQQPHQPAPRPDLFGNLFSDMKIDSEKALILLMLFVLYKNKADIKLLLALGYLLV